MAIKFTQKLRMHLNCGKDFSVFEYDVYADGVKTEIVRVIRTNGSPKYITTVDSFVCAGQEFDVLTNGISNAIKWLESQYKPLAISGEQP